MIPSEKAINLIKKFESCRLKAYQDSAGVWTIGWGTTGDGIQFGLTITQKTADYMLLAHVLEVGLDLTDLFGNKLKQDEFDALTCFVYNIGIGAFKKSTMYKLLKEGKKFQASHEFSKWVYAGGEKLNGLVKRREAERKLFLGLAD
jgi:GH24 family phage-related lysozyme (muramidase)